MNRPTAIIADDEAPLRAFLRRRLAECWPELKIIGEAENGQMALELIEAMRPDMAFLDIRMPLLSGMEVSSRLASDVHVVFVTAYDEHAIQAFEHAAVDYMLKPVSVQRLGKTVERLKSLLEETPADLPRLLARLPANLGTGSSYLQRLQVSAEGGIVIVPVEQVDYFQAADKYTLAVTPNKEWIIRRSLKDLEAALDPNLFWRIHRNAIVRLAAIARVMRDAHGNCVLHLHQQQQTISVGRSYLSRFKAD